MTCWYNGGVNGERVHFLQPFSFFFIRLLVIYSFLPLIINSDLHKGFSDGEKPGWYHEHGEYLSERCKYERCVSEKERNKQ